ncbi:MAG: DUF1772 domain-containing protein [Actinomycetota bacterium]|nr:DUF1772 domain-containing protein [Actinomycetota bacterium]
MAKRGRSDVRARVVLGAATVPVGVVAGTFFAFAVSVMPSLSTVDDKEFVELMNKLNSSIQTNRPFLLSFSGAFLLTGAAAFVHYRLGLRAAARWVLAALVLYLVSFAITIGVNMPLNVALAKATLSDAAKARAAFEGSWNAANNARTVAAMLALVCLTAAVSARRGAKPTVDS